MRRPAKKHLTLALTAAAAGTVLASSADEIGRIPPRGSNIPASNTAATRASVRGGGRRHDHHHHRRKLGSGHHHDDIDALDKHGEAHPSASAAASAASSSGGASASISSIGEKPDDEETTEPAAGGDAAGSETALPDGVQLTAPSSSSSSVVPKDSAAAASLAESRAQKLNSHHAHNKLDANHDVDRIKPEGRSANTPWFDPDLHGDEGKHVITEAVPLEHHEYDADENGAEAEAEVGEPMMTMTGGAADDLNYEDVIVTAAVVPNDDYATSTPTSTPPALVQGASLKATTTTTTTTTEAEQTTSSHPCATLGSTCQSCLSRPECAFSLTSHKCLESKHCDSSIEECQPPPPGGNEYQITKICHHIDFMRGAEEALRDCIGRVTDGGDGEDGTDIAGCRACLADNPILSGEGDTASSGARATCTWFEDAGLCAPDCDIYGAAFEGDCGDGGFEINLLEDCVSNEYILDVRSGGVDDAGKVNSAEVEADEEAKCDHGDDDCFQMTFLASADFEEAYGTCMSDPYQEECMEERFHMWKNKKLGLDAPIAGASDTKKNRKKKKKKRGFTNQNRKKRQRNKKFGGNAEADIGAGTGIRNKFKKKRNKRKKKKNKIDMYWGDRRWKKEGSMPTDIKLSVDDDLVVKVQSDLQKLALLDPDTDIPVDIKYGNVDFESDQPAKKKTSRVAVNPVPQSCQLATRKYNAAVAELLRAEEVLVTKSKEMVASPICTKGGEKYSAQLCLDVLKQVRQDIDQVMRGVSGTRDEAFREIDRYCYEDHHTGPSLTASGRATPLDSSSTLQHNMDAGITYEISTEPKSHALNKDSEPGSPVVPTPSTDHLVHEDDHAFPTQEGFEGQGRAAPTDNDSITLDHHVDGEITIQTNNQEPGSHSLNKVELVDAEKCHSATKVLLEEHDLLLDIDTTQTSASKEFLESEPCKSNPSGDECVALMAEIDEAVAHSRQQVQKSIDNAIAEKAKYCAHATD